MMQRAETLKLIPAKIYHTKKDNSFELLQAHAVQPKKNSAF